MLDSNNLLVQFDQLSHRILILSQNLQREVKIQLSEREKKKIENIVLII